MRCLLGLVALLLLTPLPVATAASTYSVDATLEVVDATRALERHVFSYEGGRVQWTLLVPDGATFVRAFDSQSTLSATVSGDDVLVESRRSPFTLEFERAPTLDEPFHRLSAQVASAPDSPTVIRLALPSGWALAGHRASKDASIDAQGALRATGPQSAEFLLLPPGVADPGPDPRVRGSSALREAVVDVDAVSASMRLEVVYDTDVFSRDWTISLPEGATLLDVGTAWGPVEATVAGGEAAFRLPYPSGYGLGARGFTMRLQLASPEPHGGSFRKVDASVPAADDDVVSIEYRLVQGALATGVRASEGAAVSGLTARAVGPIAATLAYLPPVEAGRARATVEPFVLDAPVDLLPTARATAEAVASMLEDVAGFAGAGSVDRQFFVAYTDAPVFDWEEGFYSPGLNTISIRASELRNVTDGQAHLKPVQVLVHETTHGLLDRLVSGGPGDLSFFQEGLARLAETKVELLMEGEIFSCREVSGRESCVRHSSRLDPERLQGHYRAGGSFDPAWIVNTTPADQRGFLYDYSGTVFHAYERASPPGALEAALADIAVAPGTDDPGLAAVRLVDALLLQSPTLSRAALLHPGRVVASLPLEEFRGCMGALVAPGFPFEPKARLPPGGCPEDAPPSQAERDGLTRAPTVPLPTPTPVTLPPVSTTPRIVPVAPGTDAGPDGSSEVPGGVVDGAQGVPLPGVVALGALGLAAALRTRRRD